MDETTAPVLDPGRGVTKTGYLWALARDDRPRGGEDPPGVVYFYAPGRACENAETFLIGFDGILQIDGYTGYNRLTKPSRKGGAPIRVAHCWAHARRKLKEIFDRDGSEIAAEGLRRIADFYAVEANIRGISPGQRLSARQAPTAPLVAAFGDWLQAQRRKISAKSRLGEKLTYIHNHWEGLQTFLTDGRVEIDSNRVENLIRPIALNRNYAQSVITCSPLREAPARLTRQRFSARRTTHNPDLLPGPFSPTGGQHVPSDRRPFAAPHVVGGQRYSAVRFAIWRSSAPWAVCPEHPACLFVLRYALRPLGDRGTMRPERDRRGLGGAISGRTYASRLSALPGWHANQERFHRGDCPCTLTHPKQLALWSLASVTMFGLHSGSHSESSETCARLHFCLS